ncbi:hypothetical protein SDC9_184178 [bioreactor metagenome]|uniref:Uncharacterized protein n=1 Tax=bioreactor metagenome TaxID=1076179 RepID=A0A645HCB2_9ZZZZ
MTHGAHHRHGAGGDGARQRLGVETPQILNRTAAPGHHDHIGPGFRPVEKIHACGHRFAGTFALDDRRKNPDGKPWCASPGDLDEIPHRRAVGGGD